MFAFLALIAANDGLQAAKGRAARERLAAKRRGGVIRTCDNGHPPTRPVRDALPGVRTPPPVAQCTRL